MNLHKESIEGKERLKESPRILVTGANGLVGSRFCELALPDYKFLFPTDIDKLNILSKEAIRSWVEEKEPDVLINFAALTNVNEIEKERKEGERSKAYIVNAIGPRNLAEVCQEKGIPLIQISTDFVFTGFPPNIGPYPEDPEEVQTAQNSEEISWYGWTKLMGEKAIQEVGGDFAIVRISYPFRASFEKPDFARNILQLYNDKILHPMFFDQFITPTFIDELVEALKRISERKITGIYHVASRNVTTPFAFASYLIYRFKNKRDIVEIGRISEYYKNHPEAAPRPESGGLSVLKTQEQLGMKFMSWDKAIEEIYRQNPNL